VGAPHRGGADRPGTGRATGPPTPAYDPARSLAERERAKTAELTGLGERGVSAATVRRKRLRYQARGLIGLVDDRADRRHAPHGGVDARVVEALRQAIGEATDAPSRTVDYFRWRTEQLLTQQHGDQAVAMPSRATFYRLFARLAKGRHTTGSAVTRRSLANRPDARSARSRRHGRDGRESWCRSTRRCWTCGCCWTTACRAG
jgi:putative transposase